MGEEIRRVLRTKQAKLWGEKTRSNAKRSKRAVRLCFWGKRSGDIAQRQIDRIKLNFKSNRGVAQMVARLVRDQEAVGSNPATPTRKKHFFGSAFFNEIHPSGGWNIASQCEMRLTAREIAAATGGFYFTFCGAENFTTAERLFHILHMQNISLIFKRWTDSVVLFVIRKREWNLKDERHRATVRWTVVP